MAVAEPVRSVASKNEPAWFGPPLGVTRATQSRVLKEDAMVAGVIFLTVFFALGTLLVLIVHQALLADEEYARSLAKVEDTPAIREEPLQGQPRDRAA
jgi:hypothetical protein